MVKTRCRTLEYNHGDVECRWLGLVHRPGFEIEENDKLMLITSSSFHLSSPSMPLALMLTTQPREIWKSRGRCGVASAASFGVRGVNIDSR
jgi:hypothetical protein